MPKCLKKLFSWIQKNINLSGLFILLIGMLLLNQMIKIKCDYPFDFLLEILLLNHNGFFTNICVFILQKEHYSI